MLYNLSKNDVPYYLHYYKVKKGYRYGGTYLECFKSMFTIFHNENINAFTSLFNCIISIYGLVYGYYNNFNILAISLWSFGIISNSIMSFGFHTFSPISKYHFTSWRNLDVNTIYLSNICQSLCFSILFLPFDLMLCNFIYIIILILYLNKNKLSNDKHLPVFKQIFNMVLCVGDVLLLLIYYNKNNYNNINCYNYFYYILYTSITASIIFGFKIPELFFKEGTFNKIGNSHNIMHICVSLYYYFEFMFLKNYYLYKYSHK
jgi:hypothetical protein